PARACAPLRLEACRRSGETSLTSARRGGLAGMAREIAGGGCRGLAATGRLDRSAALRGLFDGGQAEDCPLPGVAEKDAAKARFQDGPERAANPRANRVFGERA